MEAMKVHNTGYSAKNIPILTGKIAIVTGGNTGIGFETCLELVRHGAYVYMASRSKQRATEAISKIKEKVPVAQIEFLELDLKDLKQVQKAAQSFLALDKPLDILINNAGTI
jgi:NAD(P)-dependent dehydrogenase (short-subunit alcohol dehydrogenase family)